MMAALKEGMPFCQGLQLWGERGGGMWMGSVEDGVEEGVFEVSDGALLLEDVCEVFGKEDRKEAVLVVCEDKRGEAGGTDSLVEKRWVQFKTLISRGYGVLE